MVEEEQLQMRKAMGIKDMSYDASGNRQNANLALFMKSDMSKYGKKEHGIELTIKYLDPTYTIRSVPANGSDSKLCLTLA